MLQVWKRGDSYFDLWPYTGTTGKKMALSLVASTTPVRGASRTSFQSVSTTSLALTHRVVPLPRHHSAVSNVRLATLRASPMTCILGSLPTLWATVWRRFRLRLWPMGLWKLLLKCILTSSLTNQVSVAHEISSLYSCHYIIFWSKKMMVWT